MPVYYLLPMTIYSNGITLPSVYFKVYFEVEKAGVLGYSSSTKKGLKALQAHSLT
jgi:hypothetical protein